MTVILLIPPPDIMQGHNLYALGYDGKDTVGMFCWLGCHEPPGYVIFLLLLSEVESSACLLA